MLSADANPGVLYFLVGMVILVMAGVGLSLVLDKRMKASSGGGELKREIAEAEQELRDLKLEHETGSLRLAEEGVILLANAAAHDEWGGRVKLVLQRRALLGEKLEVLKAEIPLLEDTFTSYRADYRRRTWAAASGEKIGALAIRGGRDYVDAQIIRVTEAGLEIRHADGMARVQAPDLDRPWQDRFQWSDEERRRLLQVELEYAMPKERSGKISDGAARFPRSNPAAADKSQPEAEGLKLLRLHVSTWRARVFQLTSEQRDAVSRASYGSQASVPASLETWKARAVRLGKELGRAQVQLAGARARLSSVAPNDPLLTQPMIAD